MKRKIWRVKPENPLLRTILSKKLKVSPIVAQLLINRGIYTVNAARNFLSGDLKEIGSPELLKDMDKAVSRLSEALRKREKILVYGDYDADGITATALLVNFLRRLGGNVNYYVPHRINEGYGLHPEALERAKETGHTVVVTVDCGISALDTVKQNNQLGGPEIIITDHHEPPGELPPAVAVINPKRPDCDYPFKELAGVGVALKLGQALEEAMGIKDAMWQQFLDLVCVGTVADVVPLKGENRILVKNGLTALANTSNIGLQALIQGSSLKKDSLDTRQVAFALAPRLNAAGRLGDARLAVDLLLAGDFEEAREITSRLNQGNQRRQKVESMVLAEALDMLESRPELAEKKVLVLGSETWHPGVIGIVASRILEKFYRPTLLVALEGELGKGSARSIPGFHMYKALEQCKDNLLDFGGHALAAGFSLRSDHVDDFREAINDYAERILTPELMVPDIELDAVISLQEINKELINQLDKLWPYGHGNPNPILACHDVSLLNYKEVGKEGAHLKMMVKDGQVTIDGIGFNLGSYAETLATRDVDLAFVPTVNWWNGKESLQLEVKDIQPAASGIQSHRESPEKEDGFLACKTLPYEKMEENSSKMFLPGFITNQLKKIGKGEMAEEYTDISFSKVPPLEMNDRRNCSGREEIMSDICARDETTVVIVQCPYQSVELYSFLAQQDAVPVGQVILNPLLDNNSKDMIRNKSNEIRAVLSTIDLLQLPPDFYPENLILYNLPYHPEEFYRLLSQCNARRIFLLYNMEDKESAEKYLHSLAPEREYMAGFYSCLRAFSRAGKLHCSPDEVINALSANGFPGMQPFSVSVVLKIFAELKLLEYKEDKGFNFTLYPAPREKLSLNDSQTYSYLQTIKKECLQWQHLALGTTDPGDLLKVKTGNNL